jgi:hypothetical protein
MQDLDDMPKERNAFFIQVSFNKVIDVFKMETKKWIEKYGNVLK